MNAVKFLFLILICNVGYSQSGIFKKLEKSSEPELKNVFENAEKFEVQVLYTAITHKKNGKVSFQTEDFRLDDSTYFYPASTVKLPVAILSLEKLKELQNSGLQIGKDSEYHFLNDSVSHTIAKDINAIFAVSDNDAYNRLFEFLGQDYINKKLREKGLEPVRISHRFSGDTSLETVTKQMIFNLGENDTYELPVTHNKRAVPLEFKAIEKGKAYMENDSLKQGAFTFALKNYFPLSVQHQLMKQLFFPQEFNEQQRFNLTKEDRAFLMQAMSSYPQEAGYDEKEFYDSYGKFFIYGDSEEPITSNIKIYNKVGYAYGTLTETAYIHDPDNDVGFILSATILVNENETFNDNEYEFAEIGIPFLAELGRQIYEIELAKQNN
ncbi:class A beta-lactamase-related serine hydrolase [Gramella jeungdoensis]|uniref:Class A beta-lactamase-related serine hydrolase n=1 Tax=Gramella jeungdoensis TaxID=708091 RepID=A0ABT0YXX9_9FLAO|nr:serine hydrolase [Gramella jeungdoensis]MCM8567885.1 class A beta-lactamase-related serine hydrolase [Gramella jeungdoensis]